MFEHSGKMVEFVIQLVQISQTKVNRRQTFKNVKDFVFLVILKFLNLIEDLIHIRKS
jgi:hypothetical protein